MNEPAHQIRRLVEVPIEIGTPGSGLFFQQRIKAIRRDAPEFDDGFGESPAALAGLTWRGMSVETLGLFRTTVAWAGIVGAIGFCGGFFGPMVLAPQANQGPLLGLFITGPLGFVGGAMGGLIHGLRRRTRTHTA